LQRRSGNARIGNPRGRVAGFSFRQHRFTQTISVPDDDYQLVQLANGEKTLFSASYGEKMHPGLGPQAEAELLYVRQLNIRERLQNHPGEFVIWDIGLGAAANAIVALRATQEISGELRLVSFDNTSEPLEFALKNSRALGYLAGYENQIAALLCERRVEFLNGKLVVNWEFHLGDFPKLLCSSRHKEAQTSKAGIQLEPPYVGCYEMSPPHAIFYDAFSPAKNPAMWTLPMFENLFRALDPARPCALTTYSRSTLLRTTLLLAGFFVGTGHATGLKEETTIAANTLDLIAEPLNSRWLERAARSDSAEPLREPIYSRAPLTPGTFAVLRGHPQFIS
jgi:tRNA U34 5-methylaminomethyl-2-thiouridine-forming methyltransferase MnmC